MRALVTALILVLTASPALSGEPIVRAYPGGTLHAFPLDNLRGVQSLILHNVALINGGATPFTVTRIEIELLRGGETVERRTLSGGEIARLAAGGQAMQQGGMIDAVGFQFGDVLGRPAATLGATPTLGSSEALLVTSQVLSFSGQREAVRITFHGDGDRSAALTLPIATAQPPARYVFPMKGRFYVQAGASLSTHHRWAVPEEFALDIGQIGEGGRSYRTDGRRFADYHVYGQQVLAAADGEVVKVLDGQVEDEGLIRRPGETQEAYFARLQTGQAKMLAAGPDALAGNHVVVRHPWGEFSVYAHLKPGSIRVKPGQTVRAGQQLALVGSSGSSTEPHLHFHVCDGPSALACVGLPMSFSNIENPLALLPGPIQSGDLIETR